MTRSDSQLNRDGSERQRGGHDPQRANFSRSIDGLGFLDATFDTEGAEIADTALRRSYERNHRADDPRSPGRQRADAMVDIFRHYLDHQHRGTNRPHLLISVDARRLAGEAVGLCETISGYRLHPDTARRLACDAIIQRVVLDSDGPPRHGPRDPHVHARSVPGDHAARRRLPDAGLRRRTPRLRSASRDDALGSRRPTDLANGLAVCRGAGHHRLIHEGGWTITGDPNGEITFHDPDGNPRGTSRPRNGHHPSPPEPAPKSPKPTNAPTNSDHAVTTPEW